MKQILFLFALCLVLLSCMEYHPNPPIDTCKKYQDIARIDIVRYLNSNIDSIVMKVNNSIIGCDPSWVSDDVIIGDRKVVGSITHRVNFPINVRLELFSQGSLLKELFFEMDKNTVARVYKGADCPKDIDTSLDDYCWFFEKLEDPNNFWRCVNDGNGENLCTIYTRPTTHTSTPQ